MNYQNCTTKTLHINLEQPNKGLVTIFSFTQNGHQLARKIGSYESQWEHRWEFKNEKLKGQVEEAFQNSACLIFVGAVGIATRAIAPFIKSKDVDPAVLVVDELGTYVIPILSGHLGGANLYAKELADKIGALPVITTATDLNQVVAVDNWAKKEGLLIRNVDYIKYVSSSLLKGKKVGYESEILLEFPTEYIDKKNTEVGILVADEFRQVFTHTLWLTPKPYILGIGCRKDIEFHKLEQTIIQYLIEQNIDLSLICGMASIDLKAKEKAILQMSCTYKIPFYTYSTEQLSQIPGTFTPSKFVKSVTGVDNVCERSAMALSHDGILIKKKVALDGITIAVAKRQWKGN